MSDNSRTPRDWLLARHAQRETQLTALRRAALPAPPLSWGEALRALFLPQRRLWQALAAAWILIFVLHLTSRPPPRPADPFDPPPEAVARWFTQFSSHETFAHVDHRR